MDQEPQPKNPTPSRVKKKWLVGIPGTRRSVNVPGVAGLSSFVVGTALIGSQLIGGGGHHDEVYAYQPPSTPAHTQQIIAGEGVRVVPIDQKESVGQLTEEVMSTVPINLKEDAKVAIPLIIKAFQDENIPSKKVLAFAFATAEYEADFDIAKREYEGEAQAEKLKYEGGTKYYARGLGALTHKINYEKYGKRFNIDLVNNPDLALRPENSARILTAFIKDEGIADLVEQGKLEEARKRFVGNYDESDEYNKRITRYIILRTQSYFEKMN